MRHVGAMREVMWEGRLGARVRLDTIAGAPGVYAVGPVEGLAGEIAVVDGRAYVSRVTADTAMAVEQTADVGAPFLVYARQERWREVSLPTHVRDVPTLERFIDSATAATPRPLVFRLAGTFREADVHVQNLPPGTPVSSPAEAHSGQAGFRLREVEAEVVGFFSTEHQGVFTHHDSFVHLHLLSADRAALGHVDALGFEAGRVRVWLPE